MPSTPAVLMHLPSSCPLPIILSRDRGERFPEKVLGVVNFLVKIFGNTYERSVSIQLDSDSLLQDQETGQWTMTKWYRLSK